MRVRQASIGGNWTPALQFLKNTEVLSLDSF